MAQLLRHDSPRGLVGLGGHWCVASHRGRRARGLLVQVASECVAQAMGCDAKLFLGETKTLQHVVNPAQGLRESPRGVRQTVLGTRGHLSTVFDRLPFLGTVDRSVAVAASFRASMGIEVILTRRVA